MRMWMVDPSKMCRKHLMGEHVELHMLEGWMLKKKTLSGFVEKGLIEPLSIGVRHTDLAYEISLRGYNHSSPLKLESHEPRGEGLSSLLSYLPDDDFFGKVDPEKSIRDLCLRCPDCERGFFPEIYEV